MKITDNSLIEKLRKELPAAFGRKEVDLLLPGVISSKSLANLYSAGEGPNSYKLGRKVIYERIRFRSEELLPGNRSGQ